MKRLKTQVIAGALTLGAYACSGKDGAAGPAGEDGKDGVNGVDGRNGTNGADGPAGADGEDGPAGADGEDGAPGADGAQGPEGRRGPGFGREDWSDYLIEGGRNRQILARGGTGTDGDGGGGNYLQVSNHAAQGHIMVLTEGTPNTSFTVPGYTPYLGNNPKTIAANTTLSLAVAPMANSVVAGSTTIRGDDGTNPATGLRVQAGVTLTLVANVDTNSSPATLETAHLAFPEGVLIEGTIVVGHVDSVAQGDALGSHTANLRLDAGQFVARAGSVINLSGTDAPAGSDGANAGYFHLSAVSQSAGIKILGGSIIATGGDGDDGGRGGNLEIGLNENDYGVVYMTGAINTSGGTGNDGSGGAAGYVDLASESNISGGNYISGSVLARGGDGTTGGGRAGSIYLVTVYNGAIVVTPESVLDTSGGNATAAGNGGGANFIEIYTHGGSTRVAGTLRARGGTAAGAGEGGDGAYVQFNTSANGYISEDNSGGQGMFIGADIDTSGGNGTHGGNAGAVLIDHYGHGGSGDAFIGVEPVMLVGYALIDLSGGNGTRTGGFGGFATDNATYSGLWTYDDGSDSNDDDYAGGSITNEVPWVINGGNGATAYGAGGGYLTFYTSNEAELPTAPNVTNTGTLTANGGNGDLGGGRGGRLILSAHGTLTSAADISVLGGNGSNGYGGGGGSIQLVAEYEYVGASDLQFSGGNGTDDGGGGGNLSLASRFVTHAGDITANGGASVDGEGGAGDFIQIISSERPSDLSGTASLAGGPSTNDADGTVGYLFIDALKVAVPANGQIPL